MIEFRQIMVGVVIWLAGSIAVGSDPILAESGGMEGSGALELPVVEVRDQPIQTGGTGSLHLEEVSQSASRLGVSIREIPASVEVIDQTLMQERGLRTISEAVQGATGLSVGDSPGNPVNFSMRGFTNNQLRLLYDGLLLGPAQMTSRPRDTWNLDRIEVLKGPASVLYGEGALGGAINFVTKRPFREDHVVTDALLSIGSFNTLRTALGSGGPLGSDKLHYRVDLSYQRADHYAGVQRSPYTYWNLTSALLYDAAPTLAFELSFDVTHDRSVPYWGTPLMPGGFSGSSAINGVVTTNDGRTIDGRILRQNFNVVDADMSATTYWTKFKTNWQPAHTIELRNQAYYYWAERNWQNAETYQFNPGTQLIDRDRFFVQHDQYIVGDRMEAQIKERLFEHGNRFVIGVEFSHLHLNRPSFFGGGDSIDPLAIPSGSFGSITSAEQRTTITTAALFVEEQFNITEALKLVGGMRHDRIDLDRQLFNAAGVFNTTASFERSFNPTTWRAGLVYDLLPTLTLYGQYATAADPVGTNVFIVRAAENFDLATGAQWEVGAKGQLWHNRAEWTVAYFDIYRKNILTQTSLTAAQNVGRQTSKGIELSGAIRPTDAWRLQGNVTVLSARFADFSESAGSSVASRGGNRPPNVPEVMANLWSVYRVPFVVPFDLGAAFRYVGHRYADNANAVRLNAYMTTDAWVSVPYKNMTFMLRGRNLLDKTYAIWADPFYPSQVLIGAPRTVELMMTARF
ncbi:MAG: TonB-dependent receptor [Fimbriimonadaceae bacterium]|nr:TonB-dependent receptor [Fimbriimonadaceae bacterium]